MTAEFKKIDFAVQSYKSPDAPLCVQRLVNWYPEYLMEGVQQKTKIVLKRTPGLDNFTDTEKDQVYGLHYFDREDFMYSIADNTVFRINSNGTKTAIGTVGTVTRPVQLMDNGFEVVSLLQNGAGYYGSGGTWQQITDPNFPSASSIAYLDGFLIATENGSNRFCVSALNDASTWPALAFDNARASPDILVRVIATSRELFFFGTRTCEVWYNVGAVNQPFAPMNNTVMDRGCAAKLSAATNDDIVYWLGNDRRIYRNRGYKAEPISTTAMDNFMATFPNVSNAFGYTRNQNGHTFYTITFPDNNWSMEYDPEIGMWHDVSSRGLNNRYRANCLVQCFNRTFIGDSLSGKIFELDPTKGTEAGDIIIREATGVYMWDSFNEVIYDAFRVDLKTGAAESLVENPEILLSWTNDGYTFGSNIPRSIGMRGQWRKIVNWTRLGRSRNRAFRLLYSDSTDTIIMGAYVSAGIGPAL